MKSPPTILTQDLGNVSPLTHEANLIPSVLASALPV